MDRWMDRWIDRLDFGCLLFHSWIITAGYKTGDHFLSGRPQIPPINHGGARKEKEERANMWTETLFPWTSLFWHLYLVAGLFVELWDMLSYTRKYGSEDAWKCISLPGGEHFTKLHQITATSTSRPKPVNASDYDGHECCVVIQSIEPFPRLISTLFIELVIIQLPV